MRALDVESARGDVHVAERDTVAIRQLASHGDGATVALASASGHLVLDANALVSGDTVELQALDGMLHASAGALVQGGLLSVEAGLAIGSHGAPVTLAVDRLSARTGAGGIHLRDSGGLRLSGIGLEVASGAGDIEVAVTGGDLAMDAGTGMLTRGGRIDVAVQGDFRASHVDAGSGAIHVSVEGAVIVQTGDPRPNLRTTGVLTLSARNGIGGFGTAQLRVEAGELRAANAQAGNIVIFGERGLWLGDEGVSSGSPTGYVVLMSDTGRIDTGKVEALNGRIVLMTGLTSLTEQQAGALYASLLQRGVNDPSMGARDRLPDGRLEPVLAGTGGLASSDGLAWFPHAPLQPVQTTSVLLASALEMLSFAPPAESGLLDTLPQRMRRVDEAQSEEPPTSWQAPEAVLADMAAGKVPVSETPARSWREHLDALWLPDVAAIPIVVAEASLDGVVPEDRAEAGEAQALPQAEGD